MSLGHKLIGAELLACCHAVCLTNYLYRVPSFLFSSVTEFGLVTGWKLLHTAADSDLYLPFSGRIDLAGSFFKSNVIVLSVFAFSMLLWAVVNVYSLAVSRCSSEGSGD